MCSGSLSLIPHFLILNICCGVLERKLAHNEHKEHMAWKMYCVHWTSRWDRVVPSSKSMQDIFQSQMLCSWKQFQNESWICCFLVSSFEKKNECSGWEAGTCANLLLAFQTDYSFRKEGCYVLTWSLAPPFAFSIGFIQDALHGRLKHKRSYYNRDLWGSSPRYAWAPLQSLFQDLPAENPREILESRDGRD